MDTIFKYTKITTLFLVTGFIVFTSCETESKNIPTEPVTMKGLVKEGWAYFSEGDYDSAIESFNNALERNVEPDSLGIKAYQGLGWAYSRINRYSQAISNFNFLISAEALRVGKVPIEELQRVMATSNPYPVNPAIGDTFGVGFWTIDLPADYYLLSISGIESYSAEQSYKITVSSSPNIIDPGTREFTLTHLPVSDPNGEILGTPLASSLWFTPATSGDSLVTPVAEVSDIDTNYTYDTLLTSLSEYHLDPATGTVTIKPRFWSIEHLRANYQYYEKTYQVRQFGYQRISFMEELEDGSGYPVLNPTTYTGGDKFFVSGEYFNTTDGGTYIQLDAFVGMAAGYLAQGDYINAIRAARIAIFINEYLEDNDLGNYPYERNLYDGDTGYDMWNVYHLLAFSYFNLYDYYHAEICIENYMGQGNTLDPSSSTYENDLIDNLSAIEKPSGWVPPQVW